MALSQTTLGTELENLTPTDNELASRTTLAQAFGDYMKDATANAVPITAAAVDATAVPAMAGAMAFVPLPGTAATAAASIAAGIAAFWATMVAAPATYFVAATAITAPTYPTLVAALTATLTTNVGLSLEDAMAAIAADVHPLTDNVGTATFPGPIVAPIT